MPLCVFKVYKEICIKISLFRIINSLVRNKIKVVANILISIKTVATCI